MAWPRELPPCPHVEMVWGQATFSMLRPTMATRAHRKFIQMKFDSEVTTDKKRENLTKKSRKYFTEWQTPRARQQQEDHFKSTEEVVEKQQAGGGIFSFIVSEQGGGKKKMRDR